MKLINLLAGVGVVSIFATATFAASVYQDGTCATVDVDAEADACYGAVLDHLPDGENDSETLFNTGNFYDNQTEYDTDLGGAGLGVDGTGYIVGLFGITTWDEQAKVEDGTGSDGHLGVVLGGEADPWDGSFSWSGPIYENMLIVLKQGKTFAAYLYEGGTFPEAGLWDTTVGAFGNNAGGISHITVYSSGIVVPLPAAGWLMLGGFGALAALRRKKRS